MKPLADNLAGAFARASQRHAHAIALSDGERSWTFDELARVRRGLAVRIRAAMAAAWAMGGDPEPRVALLAEGRAESVAAILAILEAGAAYVPLEPSHPVSRHAFQLRDAGASLVVGRASALERLAPQIAELGLATLVLGRDDLDPPEASPVGDSDRFPSTPIDGEQLAYVIYTSGSTGRPKGVGVCHRTVLHLIATTQSSNPCGPGQASTLFHSLAFDLSVWELWRPLLGGGRLVVVPEALRGRGRHLLDLLTRQQVSQLSLTPSALRLLIAAGFGPDQPISLSRLFVGGEAIEVERLRPWLGAPTNGLRIEALYGPTEATVWAARHPLARADLASPSRGATPIGSPLPGWTLDLDPQTGEIQLGGVALARGYFARPAMTAERFVPDPAGFGARRYRTGDRGRLRDDGVVEFLGRTDQQVKIRGFRIELGEIEATLARHPELREVAVVATRDPAGEAMLVAHGVPAAGPAERDDVDDVNDGERFRDFLREHLPAVQVPTRVLLWPELPRLSSGKIDRRALARRSRSPNAEARRPLDATNTDAASTDTANTNTQDVGTTDRVLAELWADLLGRNPEGLDCDANFFALGGHSLLLTQLSARIWERLGLRLDLERWLDEPTLAGLGRALVEPQASALGPESLSPEPPSPTSHPSGGPRPTRPARRSLWWAHHGGAGRLPSGPLHETRVWRFSGFLEPEAWTRAWERLVAAQPALRTRFRFDGHQVLEEEATVGEVGPLARIDLSALGPARARREVERRQRQLALAPFDVEQGPLVRSLLVGLAPDEHRLVLVAHHLVTDGWSDALLPGQLAKLTQVGPLAEPKDPAHFHVETPHPDPPAWMEREVTDLPVARLLDDREPGHSFGGWAGHRRGGLDPETMARLDSWARSLETTDSVVSLAMVMAYAGRLLASDTVAIAWPTAGRSVADVDRLGCFAELQLVRGDLRAAAPLRGGRWRTLDDLVRSTRRQVLRLLGSPGIGFEHWMQAARAVGGRDGGGVDDPGLGDPTHHPLVQIVLAPQDFPVAPPAVDGLGIEPDHPPPTGTRFDLEILSERRDDGSLRLDWVFPRERFDGTTIERWRRGFERFVAAAFDAPGRPLDALPWGSPAERHQVTVGWSSTGGEVWGDSSGDLAAAPEPGLFERVRRRAEQLGAATAVVAERTDGTLETLGWGELVARAQALADRLVARGLRPEEPVALCFDRGLASLTAMLGVLATGGAYFPVDPRWPVAHRQRLVRRAGARWLLRAAKTDGDEIVEELAVGEPSSARAPNLALGGERLAYLMATSGSTGEPKLVAITQRGVLRLVLGARWVDLRDQVYFHYAPETFDAATLELWAALLVGRRLVIAPPGPLSGADVARRVERHRVTFLWMTSPLFHQVAQGPVGRFRGVTDWFTGGDVVRPTAVDRLRRRLPGTRIHIAYGPTENTTFSTTLALTERTRCAGRLPIGRALTHDRLWVLDPGLRPVVAGLAGEIGVSGPGLARGYLGDPRQTAERFVPHPFPAWPGERLYRTGDRGRWVSPGWLDFLGRFDRQLKIRGIRVEPMATEHVLAELPGVEAVAVVVVAGRGPAQLGAAIVAAQTVSEAWLADLEHRARELLPEAQVPSRWQLLDGLPTTASEKIDRRRLAQMLAEEATESVGRPPQGPWEEAMAKLWSTVLGVTAGADQSFFELGGDSLRITHLAAEITRRWGLEIPLRKLFENPTLAELAREVEDRATSPGAREAPVDRSIHEPALAPAAARASEIEGPTTWAQRRLWTVARSAPDDSTDVVPIAWRLGGPLEGRVLRQALGDVLRQHEGLRVRLVERDGEPWQQVATALPVPWLEVDLSGLPAERQRAVADRLAWRGARRVFDLSRAPLWRATLVRLGPEDHELHIEAHHVLFDGAAFDLFCRDLARAWTVRSRGSSDAFGEPAPSPCEAAREQRRRWRRRRADLEPYWQERLAGLPASGLPTDRPPGSSIPRPVSCQVPWSLDRATGIRFRQLASEAGATPWMALLALHALVLERLGAAPGSALASPESGREGAEKEVLACFAELMVFRCPRPRVGESFRRYLASVRHDAGRDLAHRGVPWDHLLSPALGLMAGHDRRRHPLAQVSLAVHPKEVAELDLVGLRVERRPIVGETTHLDLEIHLWPQPDGRVEGYATYRPDLFDRTAIERWSRLTTTLARQLVAAPDRPLEGSDGLHPASRHQLLVEWNDRRHALPVEGTLHDLVRRRLVAHRRRTVMVGPVGEPWSGAKLLDRSSDLARLLRSHGVGAEAVVAVELPRGPRQLVAFLAVLEAGGCYLPIDPEHPPAHRRRVLDTAKARVRLIAAEDEDSAAEPIGPAIAVDRSSLGVRVEGGQPIEGSSPTVGSSSGPESAAYVLFTSGSSGRPKGVVVSHGAIVHHMLWIEHALPLGPADRLLQKTPAVFDASVWEHWLPLMSGARLVLARPGIERDPEALVEALEKHRITVLQVVPTQLRLLLTVPSFARCHTLRLVVCGGEALPRELVEAFRSQGPSARLVNVYGPTETTIHASWEPRPERSERPVAAIGRPLANTSTWVVDRTSRLVPPGVVGRLLVRGPGLARGYTADPRATAEVFRPAPWSGAQAVAGDRVYDTGDLARWLADGRLEWVGRADRQLKWRGVRLEPAEVEAALMAQPEVRQAVVDVAPSDEGPGQLVAWLVPEGATRPTGTELARHLRERLPAGVVPHRWQWLEALPRTAGGKVDRRRLVLSSARVAPPGAGEVPEDGLVGELARLWSEVLGIEGPVDHTTGFFDQGGHSLLATQLLARVRRVFGVDLGLAELFARPTLAELARAIRQGRRQASLQPPPLDLVSTGSADGPWPVTLAQRRLWFLHRLDPASTAYTMPAAWRITGPLDPRALEQALAGVLARHPALRTRFPEHRGLPRQVLTSVGVVVPMIDLRRHPEALDALLVGWVQRTFDLPAESSFRAAQVQTGDDEHWLLLQVHHIVYDGWSASRVVAELGTLYAAAKAGERPGLEPPGLGIPGLESPRATPGSIALAQGAWLEHPSLDAQRAYWRQQLAELPALELPLDRPRGRATTRRAAGLDLEWGPLGERLATLARERGVTPFMILLASQAALLQHWGAGDEVALGSPVAGRRQPELEGVVGFFVNLLVLRLRPRSSQRFGELLTAARDVALAAYDHQELPFERVVEDLAPRRLDERNPLVSISLALQNVPRQALDLPGCTVEPRTLEPPETRFDLEAYFWATDHGLEGRLVYRRDLLDRTTVERLAESWRRVLEAACSDPDQRLDRLPWLSPGERHQLLVEWGGPSASSSSKPLSVVEQVFDRARRRPDAVAIRDPRPGGATWSYRRLTRWAMAFAARLEQLGIGPEDRVGLLIEPSGELLAAMLGVMAAGATQVPLDPSHPAERLAWVVADADVELLVCRRGGRGRGEESVATTAPVLELEPHAFEEQPAAWRPRHLEGDQLAYVIYTSGSTGDPKGVGVSHRALARLLTAVGPPFDPGPRDVWSLFHSTAFDFSVWEIWGALASGGSVAVIGAEERREPGRVLDALEAHRVTILDLTPSALRWLRDGDGVRRWPRSLRWVLFGGEALDPLLLEPFFPPEPFFAPETSAPRWANLYGITETTVHATWHELTAVDLERARHRRGSPIGRPLGDLVARVLSREGVPVPLGVAGELWIGGPGVARGYLGRPALTADRFRPDPLAATPGARLYRSGDRVRWRQAGDLEYLGRYDDQVQLRGHRVEPGEVAARLFEDDAVASAAVVVLEGDESGQTAGIGSAGPRLAAALVPEPGAVAAVAVDGAERTRRWRQVYDSLYREDRDAPLGFDVRGWTSGIRGEPFSETTMARWRARLLRRILATRPSPEAPWRVWEIGCGSGMLLHGLAPRAERYLATDLSAPTLERLGREVVERGLSGVELEERSADDFVGRETPSFDLVILSSVIQYFHGGEQLARVLHGALRALVPGGRLFLGDVRNLATFGVYHREAELARGGSADRLGSELCSLRRGEASALRSEGELLVHPALFVALARAWHEVAGVELLPRPGGGELERHRYDVVLRRSSRPMGPRPASPFAEPWVNDPLVEERHRAWCDALRRRLARRLPSYLMPVVLETVDELPRTVNGKVDRRALARRLARSTPGGEPAEDTPGGDGLSTTEASMLTLWREVLGRPVGLDDDFFDLGGHSLLATRLMARLRDHLAREVPLAWLFAARTVRALAARLDQASAEEPSIVAGSSPVAPPAPRSLVPPGEVEEVPLAPPQERLWFVEQLEPGGGAYAMPASWHIRGPLRIGVLADALAAIVRRHHSLRAAVVGGAEGPRLRIPPVSSPGPGLVVVDLRSLGPRGLATGRRRLARLAHHPFDLERGGLLRLVLFQLAADEAVLGLFTHHLVFDGVSETLVLRELAERYGAGLVGRRPKIEPPGAEGRRLEYADYALWQRSATGSRDRRQLALERWCERLADAPALDLPTDHPRPSPRRSRGRVLWCPLMPSTLSGLDALAHRTKRSRFSIALTVYVAFLARWTGQRDLVVGTPVANRGQPWLEGIVGCFVNTVAIRPGPLDPEPFSALVSRVARSLTEALDDQDVPFAELVAALDPRRDPGRLPLVEAVFGLATAEEGRLELGQCTTEALAIDLRRTPFDLMVTLREREDRGAGGSAWGVEWRHASDLFEPTTARRQAEAFRRLLAAAVTAPETPWDTLSLISPAERQQLLIEWADGDPGSGHPSSGGEAGAGDWLGRLLAALDRRGSQLALRCRGREVSAQALASRVWHQAEVLGRWFEDSRFEDSRLASTEPSSEPRVAVLLERSPAWVETVLAVLVAGGVVVPLDPAHPRRRHRHQLEAVGPAWVLGGNEARGLAADLGVPWLDPRTLISRSPRAARPPAPRAIEPDSLAQLLFTSGTTGRPKAVGVTHRGLGHYLDSARRRYPWRGRGVPFFTSVAVDLSVTAWLLPLVVGEPVEILPDATEAATTEALLRPEGWSLVKLTPSHLELLELATQDLATQDLAPPIGALVVGGEPLTVGRVERTRRRFPTSEIFNEYGPTETTVGSTVAVPPRELGPVAGRQVAIGRPWDAERVVLLDRRGRSVPRGAVGELFIGGPGLARGYWGRPSRTAEVFVPDPTPTEDPGGRLYGTGDLARWTADGRLELRGRRDEQLSVRGHRVEPGEVEARLEALPGVARALVLPKGGGLVAVLVASEPGTRVDDATLRGHLAKHLPSAWIPGRWLWLESLPLAPSGKVDRRALEEQLGHATTSESTVLHRDLGGDVLLEEMRAIWSAVLAGENSGEASDSTPGPVPPTPSELPIDRDFFALGGHSLAALKLIHRLRSVLGIEVALHQLLAGATIRDLTAEVGRRTVDGESAPPTPRQLGSWGPLTASQERCFHRAIPVDHPGLHLVWVRRLRGPFDRPALVSAFDRLVRRHESFRTVFDVDRRLQRVLPQVEPAGSWLDGTSLALDPVQVLHRLCPQLRRWSQGRFELGGRPPWRWLGVALGPDDHLLGLTCHHLLIDGASLSVLEDELATGYRLAAAGERPKFGELPVLQPLDLAYRDGEPRREIRDAEAEVTMAWPGTVDPRRAADRSTEIRTIRIEGDRHRRLLGRAHRGATTLWTLLLAALACSLARVLDRPTLSFGTVVSGRQRRGLEGVIGFLSEVPVLDVDLSGLADGEPFEAHLEVVRRALVAALAQLEGGAERRRALDRALRCPIVLNLQQQETTAGDATAAWGGLQVSEVDLERPIHAVRDLGIYVQVTTWGLELNLVSDARRVPTTTADRLARELDLVLKRWALA